MLAMASEQNNISSAKVVETAIGVVAPKAHLVEAWNKTTINDLSTKLLF